MTNPQPAPYTLGDLIGPRRAAELIEYRIRALIEQDSIPRDVAARCITQALQDGDPWTLAEAGQTWHLKPTLDTTQQPESLYIASRTGSTILAETPYAQRIDLPLTALDDYQLTHWWWTR